MSGNDRKDSRVGPKTLIVASLASITSALVVSHIWGPGTLIGAGVTPVIVTLVSELLQRPAKVITTVRPVRSRASRRFDPVAEGRRGLDEGDLDAAWAVAAGEEPARSVHQARSRRLPRAAVRAAIVTGLVAFAIAGLMLTGTELVFGGSAASSDRTTLFGGATGPAKAKTTPDTKTSTDKTTTSDTTTTTTTTGTTTSGTTTTAPTTTQTTPTTTTTAPPPVTTTAPPPQAPTPTATTPTGTGATPTPPPTP
ncbi:MAG: Fe-S oxidoreductase [Solirubrobacterales bacterium]|nr:Fe-S oxidoreductase [Solirubrobacterales bacterium]